jgi:ABC-2 type transport system ATP-binding protein
MIKAEALCKSFKTNVALKDLNLEVKSGEIYCLLGANGAGKSTTIRLFLNFIAPTSGRALINGIDVVKSPAAARKFIAYIPEQVTLYPQLSGMENVAYFNALAGNAIVSDQSIIELLARSGITAEDAVRPLGTYSKGMRQKTGIAIAMAKQAKVLLLDEPTSGLDPEASYEFSGLLRNVANNDVAVLMATHDIFRAKDMGDRAGIMRAGSLLREMQTEHLSHGELESIYLELMRTTAIRK